MPRKPTRIWALATPRPVAADASDKQRIITTCDKFIATVLKPRFLPRITPTQFNYAIDIHGNWRAGRYSFFNRYRSGQPDNEGKEFDAPFVRLDHMAPDRFDGHWMRHTGKWWPLHRGRSLGASLRAMIDDEILHPL